MDWLVGLCSTRLMQNRNGEELSLKALSNSKQNQFLKFTQDLM